MKRRHVALVRHPEPALPDSICYGRLDIDLAPGADAKIAAILASLTSLTPDGVWTSPSRRCRVVADAIGHAMGVEVRPDARLMELDFGQWEGVPWDRVPRAELDQWAASPGGFTPPGGEPVADLVARVEAFQAELRARTGDAIVVSHGGPLKILGALLRGQPVDLLAPSQPFGTVETITVAPPSPPR